MQKPNLTKVFNSVKIATVKHSPEILMGIGITGMVTTTVMAVRATPKALELIENEKRRLNNEILEEAKKTGSSVCNEIYRLEPVDLIKVTWKCYIPAGITSENYWYTPGYFTDVWSTRRIIKNVTELLEGNKQ